MYSHDKIILTLSRAVYIGIKKKGKQINLKLTDMQMYAHMGKTDSDHVVTVQLKMARIARNITITCVHNLKKSFRNATLAIILKSLHQNTLEKQINP